MLPLTMVIEARVIKKNMPHFVLTMVMETIVIDNHAWCVLTMVNETLVVDNRAI